MTLSELLADLHLDLDPDLLAPHWEDDLASLPDDPDLLRPEVFLPLRELVGLDPAADEPLETAAAEIRHSRSLRTLWWHCYNLLFIHLDYPGGQIRNWPSLEHLFGDRHGVFYLLACLGAAPLTIARHRQLGVPDYVAPEGLTGNFHECVGNYQTLNPGLWGVDLRVIYWLRNDTEGLLYRLGRIEYMAKPFHGQVQAYRHRHSGQTIALAADGMVYTAEGYVSGRGGEPLNPDDWTASLAITDHFARGNVISPLGHATREVRELPFTDWYCALKPGDTVLEMHIPGGGNFTPDLCRESMERAVDFFPRYFPDKPFVGLGCMSWILNPQIAQIYRPDSNMVLWQQEMYLYPIASSGRDGLHFLFARDDIDPATAPRDTSMRRAYLDWLAAGKRLMGGGAFILTEDLQYYGTQPYRSQFSI
ncbi:MAG: acyltransferase domain-containing protein [Armatimonadia bacterium]